MVESDEDVGGDKDSIIELSDGDDEFKTPPPAKSTYIPFDL